MTSFDLAYLRSTLEQAQQDLKDGRAGLAAQRIQRAQNRLRDIARGVDTLPPPIEAAIDLPVLSHERDMREETDR